MKSTKFRADLLGDCSTLGLNPVYRDFCVAIGLGATLAVQKPDIA